MTWQSFCCEVCARNPTCGNDCGSCAFPPPDEIFVVRGLFAPNVDLIKASLEKYYGPRPSTATEKKR